MYLHKNVGRHLWKRVYQYFRPIGPLDAKKVDRLFEAVYADMNRLREQCELLSQDQYAKAHLSEFLRLQDRMTTVLKTFDETITIMNARIEKLEKSKRLKVVKND